MPKKKWEKPKLVVLVKGKPDESVLFVCKTSADEGDCSTPFCTGPGINISSG